MQTIRLAIAAWAAPDVGTASRALALFTLVGFALIPNAEAQSGSDRCDAALLPQITVSQLAISERVAYRSLISEANYEQARASGALNVIIEGVPIGASFEQFDEKKRQFISEQRLQIDRSEARAMFRQSLSADQLAAWTSCMTSDVPGVRVIMRDDDNDGATAEIHYVEAPGRSKRFRVTMRGGRAADRNAPNRIELDHGGSQGILLVRDAPTAKLRVVVNGRNMTDTALSLPPRPIPVTPPACEPPTLLSRGAPVAADRFPESAGAVTDGRTDPGNWNALAMAPRSVEIDLGGARRIRHVSLNPEQTPAGFTQHRVFGRRPDGTQLLLGEHNGNTISGGVFTVMVAPSMGDGIRFVRVETVSSPSSVSWREIEIFGCQ